MIPYQHLSRWVLLLGVLIFLISPVQAEPISSTKESQIYSLQQQQQQSRDEVMAQLIRADVVYLAETHDRPEDHELQLEILQSLHQQRPFLAIGMEMFQRPYQAALDRYLAGEITESALIQQTDYKRRWGYPWELYAPIVRFAKEQQLPIVALNTPSEVTRKVARFGLDNLTLAEQQWIPPKSAILAKPEAYRQRIRQIYDEIHQDKGTSSDFERFFLAQVLWDETMADRIATMLQKQPNALVVVLVGQGHVIFRDGIPNRVARRIAPLRPTRPLKQVTVLLNPPDDVKAERAIADYFWYSP
ncbi:MAG: ChaN family lipoprotein [Oscillatoriales cyanobacterium C42_A2020_001]|nr:ChaN family lipoprotein [Leptolyngbyaceae cyanobacterium C42_A2020_001]